MATFPLLKAYLLETLDALIASHELTGPFLDVGCGAGDVAAHLAARGWAGRAIDASPDAVEAARTSLRGFPAVETACETLEQQRGGTFQTIAMFDVLEHIADDAAALAAAAALQPPGGALVLVVPTHQDREWRWDDDVYGHLRRYEPTAFGALLGRAGYRLREMWDVTFPVFWLLRRGYTALKSAPRLAAPSWDRTIRSHAERPWECGMVSHALGHPALQRPVFAVQKRFRGSWRRGHEMIVLARRI